MLPIAWITCCFLLGAFVGTVSKAAKGPFMVLARRAYSTSISPQTAHPRIAPAVGLPTLTGQVDMPIWPSGGHAVDMEVTRVTAHPASYLASYDVYSKSVSGWLTNDNLALVLVIGGLIVLLAALVYLVCISSRRCPRRTKQSSQPSQIPDRAVGTSDGAWRTSQLCVHPCSACTTAKRGPIDDQVARSVPTNFDRVRAELVQLREGVDALVVHMSKADETLRRLSATHEELRGILESINDQPPRTSSEASSSNPWAIPPDHDAFSIAHFSSDTSEPYAEDTDTVPQRKPTALDDDDADSQYLSTALGLTDWSDVPPRNGYYPTLDLLLARSERGSGEEAQAWYVPNDELRAWTFPRDLRLFRVDKCCPAAPMAHCPDRTVPPNRNRAKTKRGSSEEAQNPRRTRIVTGCGWKKQRSREKGDPDSGGVISISR